MSLSVFAGSAFFGRPFLEESPAFIGRTYLLFNRRKTEETELQDGEYMLVKVVAVQARMGQQLTLEEKLCIFRQRPDYVCLPEYWGMDQGVNDFHRAVLARNEYMDKLAQLSDELDTVLIGGSIVEAEKDQLYNCAQVFDRGRTVGRYRKINPVPGEIKAGISPGTDYAVFDSGPLRIGLLLCGDVFYSRNFEHLALLEPDLIFIPTTSPYRPADSLTAKHVRDRTYFQDGATVTGAYVVKTCGVGEFMGKRLQGRSLIAAPWEILKRVSSTSETNARILSATLDIGEIREFRERMKKKRSGQLHQTLV